MEYITVKEAAEKWHISERLVQKYCAEGRIKGIRRFGRSWGIPYDAVKPDDPRRKKENPKSGYAKDQGGTFEGFMPLICASFTPGRCREYIDELPEGPKKDIALAEYYYFSGQPEKAIKKAERYLTYQKETYRLSACLLYAYANLSVGHIRFAKYALKEIKNTLNDNIEKDACIKTMETFVVITSSVLLHLPLSDKILSGSEVLSQLPVGLRAFAIYVKAHYLYLKEDYAKSAGIVEGALEMGAGRYPISAIYLHLVAVMDYMSLKQTEQAKKHLLSSWEIARHDDLIEAFGEHHGLLGGLLEAVIKPARPDDFKRIIEITYSFSDGWRKIHNPKTGHKVADDLTTTEFAVAMLAARDWTNQEIAEHMNVSLHTVKRCISTILRKLGIRQRRELKKYMLK